VYTLSLAFKILVFTDEYARTVEARGMTRDIPEDDICALFEGRKFGSLEVDKARRISDDIVLVTFKRQEGKKRPLNCF